MEGKKMVPELRFQGYENNWKELKLGEVLKIGSGKDYKHLKKGDVPVYGTGGYMTSVDEFLYDGDSVGIGRKGTIDKPVYLSGKFWTVDTLFYTHSFNKILPKFTYLLFQRINWKLYNEGSGVPSLSKTTIEKIGIKIPNIKEQQKISSFLSSVDHRIQMLQKKKVLLEQYKKEIIKKLFCQKIRFNDENGSHFSVWEEKKLGDVSDVRDGTHESPKYKIEGYPLITSKNLLKNGKISFDDINYISDEDYQKINKRSAIKMGDILFGMIGTIGNPVLLDSDGFAIKNVALIKEIDFLLNCFLIHLLKSTYIERQFHKENTGGTQKFLALSAIRNLSVLIPSLEEQKKIGSFLSSIDKAIEKVGLQVEKTKEFKKGLLQKMFV